MQVPFSGPSSRPAVSPFARWLAAARSRYAARRAATGLARLDDRLLRDIGLDRADVEQLNR